ncbi:conserved hypothetical protein [Vibrio chagasii]|nr:conserved hypothetical protein [Vibrio chagasii]CAH6948711.1 conserved hypothetical protein [Vibrio chagasii]CAH7019180.1 conserved hypothetical protein [Vibrio chagasii]CAH7119748.1 conserved hypothetical protein [Vibrio chagasii]CAH7131810.1 conserved hypothetical protein [Vibrio chagasii]
MYFSLGSNTVKKNFLDLYSRKNDINGLTQENAKQRLKDSYIQTISQFIPIGLDNISENNQILKVNEPNLCSELSTGYNLSKLDDLSQSDIISNSTCNVTSEEMADYLLSLDYLKELSPDLHEVLELAINVIFFMRSDQASGGSTSGMPGVIWVNPKTHWCINNRVEFLVHELTHNLLFIEELIRGLYSYENMYKEENWTRSAVLNKSRPLDKSYHSAVVGTELLLFRHELSIVPEEFCAHPPTEQLLAQTLTSIQSCLESHLLKPRGKEILEVCNAKLEKI